MREPSESCQKSDEIIKDPEELIEKIDKALSKSNVRRQPRYEDLDDKANIGLDFDDEGNFGIDPHFVTQTTPKENPFRLLPIDKSKSKEREL